MNQPARTRPGTENRSLHLTSTDDNRIKGGNVSGASFESQLNALIPSDGLSVESLNEDPSFAKVMELVSSVPPDYAQSAGAVTAIRHVAARQDKVTKIVLHMVATAVPWPDYDRGDGYWVEASDNSVELVRTGLSFTSEDAELATSLLATKAPGCEFLALGVAANQSIPKELVLSLGNFADPVLVLAAGNALLGADDVQFFLKQIDDYEWLTELVCENDGWKWPDWQYAFGLVTGCPESQVFWEVLLSPSEGNEGLLWLPDFLEGVDERFSDDLGDEVPEGLYVAMNGSLRLCQLAERSGWRPAQLAAAVEASDEAVLRDLAVSPHKSVREAIRGNSAATDDIRALASLG